MPLRSMRRNSDAAVCPFCGTPAGEAAECVACGHDLTCFEKLPLRSEWDSLEQTGSAAIEESVEEAPQSELNAVALAAALLGAAMCVVGLFLPANENPGFSQLESNSLIQHGAVVWTVVIFGAVFAVDLARAYQRRNPPSWWELAFPVTVGVSTARLLTGSTLYPIVNGSPDTTASGVHAAAGTGVYLVLAGALICGLGIIALRLAPGRMMKQCAACAENVLAEAQICKHCGHRLASPNIAG